MGRSKVTLVEVNKDIFKPVVFPNGNLLSAKDGTLQFWDMKSGLCIIL
jgi:hypothetical protein